MHLEYLWLSLKHGLAAQVCVGASSKSNPSISAHLGHGE